MDNSSVLSSLNPTPVCLLRISRKRQIGTSNGKLLPSHHQLLPVQPVGILSIAGLQANCFPVNCQKTGGVPCFATLFHFIFFLFFNSEIEFLN
jgi:hypothetical protein